jgi:hypothetical protein
MRKYQKLLTHQQLTQRRRWLQTAAIKSRLTPKCTSHTRAPSGQVNPLQSVALACALTKRLASPQLLVARVTLQGGSGEAPREPPFWESRAHSIGLFRFNWPHQHHARLMRPHLSHALVKLHMSRVSVNALSAPLLDQPNLVLNQTATTTCFGRLELFAFNSVITMRQHTWKWNLIVTNYHLKLSK